MKLAHRQTTLDNGLRVLTCSMPHAYSISVSFYLGIGSRYEEEAIAGAAHFVEHMLFKGTARRPSPEAIAALIEGHGGLFNAGASREVTVLWAKMPQGRLPLALDLLSDMLRHSLLLPEQVEKERRVILEEISSSQDVPEELVNLLAHDLTWPGHPLGRDVAGTPASVSGLSRPALHDFLAAHYAPQNTVVSIAGDVQHEPVAALAADLLDDWQPTRPASFLAAPANGAGPQVALIHRPIEQTHLTLHLPGLPRQDDDRFALGLLNVILGEGMSSRLFLEIRERLGLAYAVDSYVSYLADTGLVGVYAAVAPQQAQVTLAAILAQLQRLRAEPVDAETLATAREFAKGRTFLGLEDTLAVAGWFGRQEVLGGPVLAVEEAVERLEAVRAEDIQRVAHRLFSAAGAVLAVVGPHDDEETTLFEEALSNGALR